jgi:hypothetical protein
MHRFALIDRREGSMRTGFGVTQYTHRNSCMMVKKLTPCRSGLDDGEIAALMANHFESRDTRYLAPRRMRRLATIFAMAVMLAGCAVAPNVNSQASSAVCDDSYDFSAASIACMKRRIPLEQRFVQMGAMRPEELQGHIQLVRITDEISKATQDGNTEKINKLNSELLGVENNLRGSALHAAQQMEAITQRAQQDMAVDSRLPNGQPAYQPSSGGGGNNLCMRPVGTAAGPEGGVIMGMAPCN